MLRDADIEVRTGVGEAEALRDHAGFFGKLAGKPFVTLKLACTLDGRIATATGESQWITGPEARRVGHAMRARHDAVMVGAGTVRADDPSLTVRGMGDVPQPVRVVLSRGLDLPFDGVLARTAAEVPVWLCHAGAGREMVEAWEGIGAVCLPCDPLRGQVSPRSALASLAGRGITRVFCEGGGALAAALLAEGLVDELVVFGAGRVMGAEGLAAIGAMGLSRLADAPQFDLAEVRPVGPDIMSRWVSRD
jgi:diaminohydroxyphosphoribosylaminopyrimidine deaminase/5-amino-6-(5-phosphoribosylamino)uracil reductase